MEMKLKVSKNVKPGCVVKIRGDKICVATHRTKNISGIYQEFDISKVHKLDGSIEVVEHPEGIVFYGKAKVKIATQNHAGQDRPRRHMLPVRNDDHPSR